MKRKYLGAYYDDEKGLQVNATYTADQMIDWAFRSPESRNAYTGTPNRRYAVLSVDADRRITCTEASTRAAVRRIQEDLLESAEDLGYLDMKAVDMGDGSVADIPGAMGDMAYLMKRRVAHGYTGRSR